ncbi:MAG: serine/threonine protein kinase [bacterium]|nr:serine/threonine protein kinase [bacterium]
MDTSTGDRTRHNLRSHLSCWIGKCAGVSVDRESAKRLGGFALIYAVTYTLAFSFGYITQARGSGNDHLPLFLLVAAILSVSFGFVVYFLCRRRILPRSISVQGLAGIFEVIAAFGIMAMAWGWEQHAAQSALRFARALGIDQVDYQAQFLTPLSENNVRMFEVGGVAWLGVFILTFPMLIPSSPRRTLAVSLCAFATAPLVLLGSLAAHGVPEEVKPWLGAYLGEMLIPVGICVLIAVYGSSLLYRLSRDLTKAQEMGSYRLTEQIGAGGMGEVWRAKHNMLARPAAIKIIRTGMLGPVDTHGVDRLISRFEREAQATAALNSPHTIQLYDFGRTGDDTFYYVMELLEGYDLRSLVKRQGPLPAARVIPLLRQVCHSLYDAHQNGLTHRDIKPANIFISRRGQDADFVKVLDFGLVKSSGNANVSNETQLTTEGIGSGTPAFMAPEMVTDQSLVDHRVDIYALGCVAYWLLVGAPVFEDDNALNVIVQHVKEPPPTPSSRSELNIPAELDRIVLDCLAKAPAERPQTARELSERLAACKVPDTGWTEAAAQEWWENNPQS